MVLTSIVLALLAATGLAVGTHLQHHAVRSTTAEHTARPLVLRPLWLLGLGLLIVETILNVAALGLGPVALVQPIGTVSLVLAVLISVKVLGRRLSWALVGSVALTLAGVAGFVALSARHAHTAVLVPGALTWLNGLLLLFSLVGAVLAALRATHLVLVGIAGLSFGTVAASAHVVATSVIGVFRAGGGWAGLLELFSGGFSITVVGIALASVVGMWAVQVAYASGPPETVLAGLSVVDPITAVAIGSVILAEYSGLNTLSVCGLLITGAAAVAGVLMLAHFHPDAGGNAQETIGTVQVDPRYMATANCAHSLESHVGLTSK